MTAIKDILCGKRVGFFGIGKSNLALIDALPLEKSEIILRSDKEINKDGLPLRLRECRIFDGKHSCAELTEDVLFFSPSVRRDRRELLDAREAGVIFSSDAELFFANNAAPIYAVTGSDGKSTTATFVAEILGKDRHAKLVGNVGVPMFSSLTDKADCYITELSSFMLSYTVPRAKRAAVTNITPNHLDWHRSFEEYRRAKLSLLDAAEEKILSFDDVTLREYASENTAFAVTSSEVGYTALEKLAHAEIYVTLEKNNILLNGEPLIAIEKIRRKEPYNLKNLMTAIAMTWGDVTREAIRSVAEGFAGLPHRCQHIGNFRGVDYYDSSIDSTPSRTAETLLSLGKRVVVILGGRSKGVSYAPLVPALRKYAHAAVITGECSDEIYKDVRGSCRTVMVDGFEEAVAFAAELGRQCGTVLLSPASTSYDTFKNYEERGERFRICIEKNKKIC